VKKALFLFAAVFIFASFISCDNNISYPVNRVEIQNEAGQKLTGIVNIPVASNYKLIAAFFNSKNEPLPVSNPENIVWTMSNGQNSWFEPTNTGYEVFFNPPLSAAGYSYNMTVFYNGIFYTAYFDLKAS